MKEVTIQRKAAGANPANTVARGGDLRFPLAYEDDFHGWLLGQASTLRQRKPSFVDWEHIAEELETVAGSERRAFKNQLKRLLLHLLKLQQHPQELARHGGWRRSIRDARQQIEDIVEDSPGILQGRGEEILVTAYKRARIDASEETKSALKNFPEQCPWSYEDVVREDFFPGEPCRK